MGDFAYQLIKKSLDASALRQKVISHNLANINTRGFKRSEVIFEDELKDKLKSNGNNLDSIEPEVVKDESTSMRLDGNNVDLDYEMSNQAANSLLYYTLVSQANAKIGMMRYVISEGRK